METRDGIALERVLVLLPSRIDSERAAQLLAEAQVPSTSCLDLADLCRELRVGAGAMLLTDATLLADTTGQLAEALRAHPTWSSVPIVVITADGAKLQRQLGPSSEVLRSLMVVERPVRTRTLLSMVLSALRTRTHQYEIRDAILQRERQAAELMANITERERMHEALEVSESELARQAEQLRDADRLKDDFLATLAHELRNPLAPIRAGLELLANEPSPDVSNHTLGVMRRQLSHMVRLIDDLLDVSRITRGKLDLKLERVELRNIIDSAIEASRPFIEYGRHTLQVSIPDEPIAFDADLTRIAQVISNLLNNASKYTPPGGKISLVARRDGDSAVIEVSDNGVGIPADRIDDVFTMFSQVNRALDRTHSGLGIGLALVRRFVEMHAGTVSVASRGPGQGSTFSVRLPLAAATTAAASELPAAGDAVQRASKRILIVDDNDDAADLLSLVLKHAGHVTSTAYDGPSAIAAVEAWSPHVVFLDIGLPGMSGYDVARELRGDPRFTHTALVALTGWGTEADKRKAEEAGFDAHLTKPIDMRTVQGALDALASSRGW